MLTTMVDSMSVRLVVLRCLAVTSGLAAVIHFAVAGEHFDEYWAFGVFFLAVAWLQLSWAVSMVVRPSRTLLAWGVLMNAAVIVVYVVTRTVGDLVGPTPREVEPVGFGDAFSTVCEALIVAGSVLLLLHSMDRLISRAIAARAVASVAAVAIVALSVSLVNGGPEMTMAAGEAMAGTPVSLSTDSPAGAVIMPDPTMQMATGMKMVGGPCTATPTAAQQSAAVHLVNRTWAENRKYRSLAAAKAAGYRPVTPSGRRVVHYINPAYYRATAGGGPVINPSAPQSLVYANTPHGAVLAAVMYISRPRSGTTSYPGGCLTQWHVHTNLCFRRGAVVGVTHPDCPAGAVNRVSPPMLHIWFVPISGGPTAIDASNRQVVDAAEQVGGPHNGTA